MPIIGICDIQHLKAEKTIAPTHANLFANTEIRCRKPGYIEITFWPSPARARAGDDALDRSIGECWYLVVEGQLTKPPGQSDRPN